MQVKSSWSPPTGVLGRLCGRARERSNALEGQRAAILSRARAAPPVPSFLAALQGSDQVAVIAELKRRSPSKGALQDGLSASERAVAYAKGGAAALSVLTEPTDFGGSNDDLEAARSAVPIPLLRKDFHVTQLQVWESRACGASALLLIARALGPESLWQMMAAAREVDMEALVEVRSEEELGWAVDCGATAIGVNARNLETLEMSAELHGQLLPAVPARCVAVAESGLSVPSDVERVAGQGADAVLVGSALSVAADGETAVRSLLGIPRRPRGH